LCGWRIVIEGLLQRFGFRTLLTKPSTSAALRIITAPTSRSSHQAQTRKPHISTRIEYLLHEGLDCRPVGVVGKCQLIPDVVHHALLELRGVKVAAATALTALPSATV
jgi:hypothetical protein